MNKRNSKIESMGIYLPGKLLTTADLISRCRHKPRWDIERITGIRERRVAAGEFAVDLAIKAAKKALSMSRYKAEDLDILICTSISKYNRKYEFDFEPATSVLIRKAIGATKALTFDVVNACAGIFNGIHVMDAFLKSDSIRCGMVVSGEHNMPLVETATKEIRHSFDRQLASLTLGDCGAAVILDSSSDDTHGFHYIEMVTGAKHNHYCYSKPSRRGPGGVLITKARGLQRKGAQYFPYYLKKAIDRTGWRMDEIDVGIAHQISVRGIKRGVQAVKSFMGCDIPDPFVYNVEKYGNTTTTSHFLILHEYMLNGRINKDHKILFVSGASGIVITHATYTMDELSERYRVHFREE